MDNKISIGRLTAMLAIATGKQKRLCEDFIKELFQIVVSELEAGESIRIKGFGTFRLVEVEARKSVNVATGEENRIPGYRKVSFTPSKELAVIVNSPFEDFVAVEISDELSTDELLSDDVDIDSVVPEEVDSEEDEESPEEVESPDNGEDSETDLSTESYILPDSEISEERAEKVVEDPVVEEPEEVEEKILENGSAEEKMAGEKSDEAYFMEEEEHEKSGKGHFIWGAVFGFIAACVIGAAVFIIWGDALFGRIYPDLRRNDNLSSVSLEQKGDIETLDSISPVKISATEDTTEYSGDEPIDEAKPAAVVKDTVTTTRYLTTIARMHYGNFNLWPLIYEENEKILGHPDRIRPGTEVIVPPLSKFGIDPKNPEDIARIKQKGQVIYSRFKKVSPLVNHVLR